MVPLRVAMGERIPLPSRSRMALAHAIRVATSSIALDPDLLRTRETGDFAAGGSRPGLLLIDADLSGLRVEEPSRPDGDLRRSDFTDFRSHER